jgi:hypothetical protein
VIGPVADLADLAVGDRLARHGFDAEHSAALRALDARCVEDAPTATTAAVERLARWYFAAGRPDADLDRLVYSGDDAVRAQVEGFLARMPRWAAWWGVEHVEWIEIGRGADGRCGYARSARALDDDTPHRILICGALTDERISEILPHELAHSVHKEKRKVDPSRPTMPTVERDARALILARDLGIERPEALIADSRADEEFLAEATAQAWGFPRPPLYYECSRRRRGFIAELNAASELVPSIKRECARRGTP